MPKVIRMRHLDNGFAYGFAAFLPDAPRPAGLDCAGFERDKPLVRATADHAAAKGSREGSFRAIEQTIPSAGPGYVGGDRMTGRRPNRSKAPSPIDAAFDPKSLCRSAGRVFPVKGDLIGIALPDPVDSRLDPAAAAEAARRRGVVRDAMRAEAADLNRIDVRAERIASGRRQAGPPVPSRT